LTYKYNGINHPPEQIGIYIEETVTLADGSNQTGTTYDIATNMIKEQWLHDPDNNGSYNQGVVKLYNETDSANIYSYIDTVSSSMITTTDYEGGGETISVGEEVTIGYYAIGTDNGSSDQITNPSRTASASDYARPETFQSMFNILDIKSPRNLPQLGYKWADVLARKKILGSSITTNITSEAYFDPRTDILDDMDWSVEIDTSYPMFLTEIRHIVDNKGLLVEPWIILGMRTTNQYFTEGGNNYIDINTSSCTYKTNDANVWINSLPLGLVACDSVNITMERDTFGLSDTVIVEISGWYRPRVGG
jgi:hypothetical protein